ncbi:MAG: hypothetical protein V1867_02475 [Candidatus Falkowbacteria bacterium]
MSTIKKVIMAFSAVVVLGLGGFLASEHFSDSGRERSGGSGNIVADYKDLLNEAERLKALAGENCENKKDMNQRIDGLEEKLADLAARKKAWLDNNPAPADGEFIPPIPGSEPLDMVEPVPGPSGSADVDYGDIPPIPGSEPLDMSESDPVPSADGEFIPPIPGSEPLDMVEPSDFDMINTIEKDIISELNSLKALCNDEEKKKAISDKCGDACQRHKDCAAYTEDATPGDLNDAYDACMEECAAWPKEMIKCINAIDIKAPNDCVSFLNCRVPQFFEEKYLE